MGWGGDDNVHWTWTHGRCQDDNLLLQYYSVLQSTTPALLRTTPVLLRTTKYYSVLQSTTPVLLRTTKYYSSTTPYYKVLRFPNEYEFPNPSFRIRVSES